jgi:hypothetical protein
MPAQRTSVRRPAAQPLLPTSSVRARTDVDTLTYSELAVAICAAGLPADRDHLSASQIEAVALAGLARLGRDEVRRIDCESRRLSIIAAESVIREVASRAQRADRRLWPSARAKQIAFNLAYRVLCDRDRPRPVTNTNVPLRVVA